jgi:predicted RNase H-like nuclease (RuvC/YqgF family)
VVQLTCAMGEDMDQILSEVRHHCDGAWEAKRKIDELECECEHCEGQINMFETHNELLEDQNKKLKAENELLEAVIEDLLRCLGGSDDEGEDGDDHDNGEEQGGLPEYKSEEEESQDMVVVKAEH